MDWILYFLLFIFGYFTCRTFYFLRSARTSLKLVRVGQLISLGILAKTMENFHYAATYRIGYLTKSGFSDNKIEAFKKLFEGELTSYQERSIREIKNAHSGVFHDFIEFDDWNSAMAYLDTHRNAVDTFFLEDRHK